MSTLREELDAARQFLAPAWERGNDDVVVRLSNTIDIPSTSDPNRHVIVVSLDHLLRVHEADIVHQNLGFQSHAEGEYDEDSRKTLYGLLDLIAVRGILPSLSSGVAAKHRPRPMIPDLKDSTQSGSRDIDLLGEIIKGLNKIYEDPGAGLAPLIRERILADVIAGVGELAFCPGLNDNVHTCYVEVFAELIKKTPVSSALPLLTYLMQPATPSWLKSHLSKQLSLIPLRHGGVRHTIEFIASSYPQAQQSQDRSKGIPLPLEALNQASRLLSSVPSSMEAEPYFTALCPQLLSMLDGAEGPELSKAAALIIGSGILGKRATGAPGTVGWRLFAEHILTNIGPSGGENVKKEDTEHSSQTFVPEKDLKLALTRLVTLLTSHPSPGLTKRLVGPLMLPLWSLLEYAKSHPVDRFWNDSPWKLLETFFRLGAGAEQLEVLAVNLLWDGPPAWTFAPGGEGGVEIRYREKMAFDDGFNVIEKMGNVEQRIATYQDILLSQGVEDQDIGDLFVRLSRRWLVPHAVAASGTPKLEASSEEDPLQSLIIAKLVMAMLEKFKDRLATDPDNMIELVKQLLDEWNESEKAKKKRAEDLRKATYAGLGNIVQQQQKQSKVPQDTSAPAEVDSNEVLPVALSLLNTLISDSNFRPTTRTSLTLSSILPTLEHLRKPDPGSDLAPSISITASNLTTLISTLLNIPPPTSNSKPQTTTPTNPDSDKQTLTTALTDLTSPHAPIRAAALNTIDRLAASRSPAVDLPQLTLHLLRTALPDPDEYVHLSALSALTTLAHLDPQLVVPHLLVPAFLDADQSSLGATGLETRLRIGEVLGRVVQDAAATALRNGGSNNNNNAPAAYRTAIQSIAAACTTLSSRRGARTADARLRAREARLAQRRQRDAERAWGGEAPPDPALLLADEEEGSEQDRRDAALLAAVVDGWRDTGVEEDARLRALALGVLARVVEAPGTLGCVEGATVAAGVDVAVGALVVEGGESRAVVRRAGVMVLWGLVRAMDAVLEDEGQVPEGAGLLPEKWEEVERVVAWARDQDEDAIVKGHAAEVLEALETWRVKKALGVRGDGSLVGQNALVTDDLGLAEVRGLNVNIGPGVDGRQGGGRKFVIEEIE